MKMIPVFGFLSEVSAARLLHHSDSPHTSVECMRVPLFENVGSLIPKLVGTKLGNGIIPFREERFPQYRFTCRF